MHVFVFAFYKFFAMLFLLTDNSLNVFPAVLIAISIASSCFMNSRVSREVSSIPAKLYNAKFATTIRSWIDWPDILGMTNQLCTSLVASCIHSSLQNVYPKIMHILCNTRHVKTKSDTFFKCTSTLFRRIRHLPLSISNACSTHMRVELWTKFQSYSSRKSQSLWPLKGANIHGRQGYAASPTKQYGDNLLASQCCPIAVIA